MALGKQKNPDDSWTTDLSLQPFRDGNQLADQWCMDIAHQKLVISKDGEAQGYCKLSSWKSRGDSPGRNGATVVFAVTFKDDTITCPKGKTESKEFGKMGWNNCWHMMT